jgi:hypothetical protein
MVDPDLIEGNLLARQGLKLLVESGILLKQKERLLDRLTSGDSNEDDEALAKRIREYRTQAGCVASLQELGEQIKSEENDNEPR